LSTITALQSDISVWMGRRQERLIGGFNTVILKEIQATTRNI
jgi:uncharacterized protein YegJ (DUF2314 family)